VQRDSGPEDGVAEKRPVIAISKLWGWNQRHPEVYVFGKAETFRLDAENTGVSLLPEVVSEHKDGCGAGMVVAPQEGASE
jgi:hypothetical protein